MLYTRLRCDSICIVELLVNTNEFADDVMAYANELLLSAADLTA